MATIEQRVGREGFTGSPLTVWCDSCRDYVITKDSGCCVWCDEPVDGARPLTRAERQAERRRRSDIVDRRIVKLRHSGMSYSGIVTALRVYDGVVLGVESVRSRARAMGVKPDERFRRGLTRTRQEA